MIEMKYLLLEQPAGVMYIGVMKAKDLINITKINRRSDINKNDSNIQRDADNKRVNSIAEYANSQDALFPTPIIISGDSEKVNFKQGYIKFSDSNYKFSVIDGQHRILGIEKSGKSENINLPVTVIFDTLPYQDASIFTTINSNQKQVSKSLIYDLFEVYPGRSEEKTCHILARRMNEDPNSPFYNRLKMLGNKGMDQDFAPLSQAGFIEPLLKLVKDGIFKDFYKDEDDDIIYKILLNYFNAVKRVFPVQWDGYEEVREEDGRSSEVKSILPKSIGYMALIDILPDLFGMGVEKKSLKQEFFVEIFEIIDRNREVPFTNDYYGSSASGAKKLSGDLIDALNKGLSNF